ncbi:MAG: polysaccharide biosynthesis/export family protein [Pseudomonadota bacterium]
MYRISIKSLLGILPVPVAVPLSLLLSLFWVFPAAAQDAPYLLNPGDLLQISVWKEEGMERDVLVLPDGTISFPLAGHIKAAGQTPLQVQQALANKISEFIPDPPITVTVQSTAGNKIYVVGQVNNPGEFPIGHRIDVMQALTLAGGLTAFGDEDDIRILRRQGSEQDSIPFDYSAVKKGQELSSNIVLKSGDIVVVPD